MAVASHNTATPEAARKTQLLLSDLWQRNRTLIEKRLAILDCASAAAPLSEETRAAALDVSHKLSGSLGMFGFEQGTIIARELEQIFESLHPETARIAELTKQLREMLLPPS